LQRDSHGRIFLDVNSECFQAIITNLNELMSSSEDNRRELPYVDREYDHILRQQLELFAPCANTPTNSNIIPSQGILYDKFDAWRKRYGFGIFLRYSGTRDGLLSESLSTKCNEKGSFIFIMQTADQCSLCNYYCHRSDGFEFESKLSIRVGMFTAIERKLFAKILQGGCDSEPSELSRSKYKLLQEMVVLTHEPYGSSFSITQLEVFEVFKLSPTAKTNTVTKRAPVVRFQHDINNAINKSQDCLPMIELKVRTLEDSFNKEHQFVSKFAYGYTKDVITLNVRGTMMGTTRSTLRIIEDSVLTKQFDDSKWTEQGYINLRVKGWSADDVCNWVNNIEGIQEDIGSIFKKNSITGCELLALNFDGLEKMGIGRAGTVCLLQKEIEALVKASQDVVSVIDHCPYCFGKIFDFLRLKQLYAQGLAQQPALPDVPKSQKERFEKVVNFYFPGDAAKHILGS